MEDSPDVVCGVHPVLEVLRSGSSRVQKVYIAHARQNRALGRIRVLAREAGVPVRERPVDVLDRMAGGARHQGVVALVLPFEPVAPEEMVERAREAHESALLLALDRIHDPQNVGSLLRVAECAGAHGVMLCRHESAPLTPAVRRVSAGACEHMPMAWVSNLARELNRLKEMGLWVFGADPSAPRTLYELDWTVPLVLVIGNEETGIRAGVRRACDEVFRIPMAGRISSLNASASGAIVLFEALRQRGRFPRGSP